MQENKESRPMSLLGKRIRVRRSIKYILSGVAGLFIIWMMMGAGSVYYVQENHRQTSLIYGTYANSAVDTIYIQRDPYLSGIAFSAHWKDSVAVTNAILRRMIGGELMAVQAGDTLFTVADSNTVATGITGSASNPSFSDTKTITVTPLCDQYRIIITYAATKNGVTNNKVDYIVQKQYYTN